ncbi:OLC1v1019607C1 [Oldenlandia corymbosa var. corymbosa]|uniref:OLC1v1019607C1 n=1 Tax=Oldenlandia corymbosa var. corymbosa TaxID=529605 RepID=A0AAV1EEJ6_OLDCO|nr:OLC1v1019607C1 [Oldenlandia corymbosa var. corymbosa]
MKCFVDLTVLRGRLKGELRFPKASTFILSDARKLGLNEVDFGWGNPVYAGPAIADKQPLHGIVSFVLPKSNKQGVKGMVVPVCLPEAPMERFSEEINMTVKGPVLGEL